MLTTEVAVALADDAITLAVLQDKEISASLLTRLNVLGFPDNLAMLPVGGASLQTHELMRAAVSGLPADPPTSLLDDLAADFAAIYLTGAYGASPSESFWLSDDHLVCQEAMFDLRALYAACGLAAPDWRKMPDDHLVFQLQFVARLLELAVCDDDWRSLADFLDYHLLRWLPDFSSRVAERCDTVFYGALVILTNNWCQQLRDLIAQALNEARPSREEIESELRAQREAAPAPEPVHFFPGMHGPSW